MRCCRLVVVGLMLVCVIARGDEKPQSTPKVPFVIDGMAIGDSASVEFLNNYRPIVDRNKPDYACRRQATEDGVKVMYFYFFQNHRLVKAGLEFPSADFDKIMAKFNKAFGGAPQTVKRATLANKEGDSYENFVATWPTNSGAFVVDKFFGRPKYGYARLKSPEYKKPVGLRHGDDPEDFGRAQ